MPPGPGRHNWLIDPHGKLGPLRLGASADQVVAGLGEPTTRRLSPPLEFLEFGDVTVVLHSATVSMIIADDEYMGATPEGVRPGMRLRDARALIGDVWYDEEESLWHYRDADHAALEIVRPTRPGETPIDGPWIPEAYEMSNPDEAIILRIYLLLRSEPAGHKGEAATTREETTRTP